MPRMSEAEKQRSHQRILEAAARLFRANGIGDTSVSDVMTAAGMTHGGFYRHFASKEDLVSAAFRHAVDGVVSAIEREETLDGRARERQGYIDTYLSSEHVENNGKGCPLAALGVELARAGGVPQQEGAAATARMANLLQKDARHGDDHGFATMALLLGTVTLARLAETEEDAEKALEAGRAGVELLHHHWPE